MTDKTQKQESVLNDAFSMQEHLDYINSPEFQELQKQRLIDNVRKQKTLEIEKRAILSSFADPEKKLKILDTVNTVWGKVLETNTEVHTVEDIVRLALERDTVLFFNENKYSNYFPSEVVFENHQEHPIQKTLVKDKHLGRRQVKKQKTPLQTINYVYGAKSASDKEQRLNALEESLQDAHNKITALAIGQLEIQSKLNSLGSDVEEVSEELSRVQSMYKDRRKILAYILLTTQQHLTTEEVAEQVGVKDKRTIFRWLYEFKENQLM